MKERRRKLFLVFQRQPSDRLSISIHSAMQLREFGVISDARFE